MSIIIKTMTNLPEYCYDCPCHDGESGYCQADKEHRYSVYRPFWCPLVKISMEQPNIEDMLSVLDRSMECMLEDEINAVLDKIRAEIEQAYCKVANDYDHGRNYGLYMAIQIIDKYKAEGSESDGNND